MTTYRVHRTGTATADAHPTYADAVERVDQLQQRFHESEHGDVIELTITAERDQDTEATVAVYHYRPDRSRSYEPVRDTIRALATT